MKLGVLTCAFCKNAVYEKDRRPGLPKCACLMLRGETFVELLQERLAAAENRCIYPAAPGSRSTWPIKKPCKPAFAKGGLVRHPGLRPRAVPIFARHRRRSVLFWFVVLGMPVLCATWGALVGVWLARI